MKNEFDLGFCKLYSKKTINYRDKILIVKAYNIVKKFFNISLPKFDLVFVGTRKEFNRLLGRETPIYMIGFVNRRGIVIFSPEKIGYETCWKRTDFYSTMVHEISHLFFRRISKKNVPVWLNEGLATYLQNNCTATKKRIKISYPELTRKFNTKQSLNYNMYWGFVYYLIKYYKKEKIMKIMKKIGKSKNNEKLFKFTYGKTLKDLIKDVNNKI